MQSNIEEEMLTWSTKISFCWSIKGQESKQMNSCFKNSISLIKAITSLGDDFAADTTSSILGKLIYQFLREFELFIKNRVNNSIEKLLIIVDNALIYRWKYVKDYIKLKNLSITFILAYFPELALVEKYLSNKEKCNKANSGHYINKINQI